jgi:hypothetical protein
MKKEKKLEFTKLLDLGKENVAKLNNDSMGKLQGGSGTSLVEPDCYSLNCPPTMYCTWASSCPEWCQVDH